MKETLRFAMSTEVDNPPDVLSTNIVLLDVAVEEKQGSLSDEVNRGLKGTMWNTMFFLAILVVGAGAVVKILSELGYW